MVGISAAITDNDSVITSYRDHCTHLAKGGTMLEVMAELMGRVDGASKGKGGSMHMYRKVSCKRPGASLDAVLDCNMFLPSPCRSCTFSTCV